MVKVAIFETSCHIFRNNYPNGESGKRMTNEERERSSSYLGLFLLFPPQKVLSVEDGKIPTKKVKVDL